MSRSKLCFWAPNDLYVACSGVRSMAQAAFTLALATG